MFRKIVLHVMVWGGLLFFGSDQLAAQKMYWTEVGTPKIQRANLDGTNVEDIVTTGLDLPWGITVHVQGRKIYWDDWGTGEIKRADMDGSNVEIVTSDACCFSDITIDPYAEKLYWTYESDFTGGIQRSNLDGSSIEQVVSIGPEFMEGIAIDPVDNKIYWTHQVPGMISRSNLDGTDLEFPYIEGLTRTKGIAINHIDRKMYWSEVGNQDPGEGKIRRANLDGTNMEDVVTGLNNPWGIQIDAGNGKVYWIDSDLTPAGRISRANLNGTEVETLVTGLGGILYLALDITLTDPPVPTVSQWGLVAITLLLMCGGTLILRRRIAPPHLQ